MNAHVLRCRNLAVMAALLLLAGCSIMPPLPASDAYEYRYRVFQAGKPLPSTMKAPLPIEILTERTLPPGALNHSMDQLAEQGYKLHDLERIPDTDYYIFNFRKPVIDRYLPTVAPMEFTGVYHPSIREHLPIYYVFTPKYPGYNVALFGLGAEPIVLAAQWDGKVLTARRGETNYTFVLAGDGRMVTSIEEAPVRGELQRTVTALARVEK